MSIDKKFVDLFLNVTSKAALASHFLVGKKNKIAPINTTKLFRSFSVKILLRAKTAVKKST